MKTRLFLLLAPAFFALASRAWCQAPAAPAEQPAPFNATVAPAPATPAPAAGEVTIKETEATHPTVAKGKDASGKDTLSVDFPDEDVRNILRNVADLFELNLVIPEGLQGKASIKLRDVTWRQIFQVVLQPLNYTFVEEGNIIKIVSNESLLQEPVATEVFIVNYARAADLVPPLQALVNGPGAKIVVDARSNSLVITEAPSRMGRIRPIIEQLDRATDQVMIESKFVEVTDGDVRNIGVNWASLKNYKVGVGPDNDGTVGTYKRSGGGSTATGADSNATTGSTSTNGTTGSTTSGTTATNTSGSNTSSGITATNGVSSTTASTTVNGAKTTTGTDGSTSGTTTGTTATSSETLSLLNSIAGGVTNTRTLNAIFTADQFGLVLSALNEFTKAKIVSNPTVVTLNNTEAFINIGQEYPLPQYTYSEQKGSFEVSGFTYRPIGIILKVTPQVNARGFIKLAVEPEVSSTNRSVSFGGASGTQIPIIDTKKAKTQISLRDGYTMGLGGLIDSTLSNTDTKVPVLGSIPVLGRLFSSKARSTSTHNLLIFITAKTLPSEGAPPGVIFDPRQIRAMDLRPDDLPGFRDGSDPFKPLETEEAAAKAAKKAKAKK